MGLVPREGANYGGSGSAVASPPGSGRRRLRNAALATAALAGLAGTLGTLSDLAWWLELFTHFRPQYAALLAAAGIVLAATGAAPAGIAALVLAAANALPLAHYLLPRPPPAPPGPELRVALANVWFRNEDPPPLLDWLRERRPDLVVLLEVTPRWEASLSALDDILPFRARSGRMLVASRQPLAGLRAVGFGDADAGAMVFATALDGRPVTVIGAHATWPLGPGSHARQVAQLEELARIARVAPGPVLLLGDLNLSAFAPRFARLLERGGLADCAAGRGLSFSWPAQFPPLALRIDHCLHGAGLVPVSVGNGPRIGSDHLPLEVVLRPALGTPGRGRGIRTAASPPTSPR